MNINKLTDPEERHNLSYGSINYSMTEKKEKIRA